jgi:autotransporter-associated beta strand protein
MIVNGGTLNTGTIDSWAKIGDQGVGYLELNGTSTFTNKDAIDIGEGNAQGHGKVVVQGQATMTTTNSGIWVGNAAGALGELEIKDHGTVNSLNNELEVPWAGTGILTVGDGLATSDANLNCMMILLGWDAASTSGTVNLKTGGTISTNYFYTGSAGIGHAAVNFDGGVLKALQNNANFITNTGVADFQLNVLAGGAKINSNGFNIAITEPLRNGIVGTDGGLTKSGVGTLTLPVKDIYAPWTQTYNGPTVVTGGALVVGAGTTMATTGITLSGGGNMTVNTSHALTSTLTTLSLGAGSTLSIGLPSEATVGGEIVTNAMNLVATTNLYLTPNGGTVDPAGYDVFAYTSKTGTVADLAVALNPAYHAHIAPGDVTDSGTAIHVGITSDAVDLTWNATPTGDWDVNVTSDWLDPSLASVAFLNLDRVHFTAATTGSTANIVGTVQPGSIDATGGTVQTLAGTGGIVGEGTTLSVTGATLNVVNTGVNFFTGDVTVSGAGSVLNFTPSTALGLHNTITVDTGALNASADWTMANGASQDLVAIGGTVTVAGTLNAATRVDTTANITAVATSTVTVGGNVNLANAAGSTASLTVDNSTMTVGGHLYGGFANGSSVALAVTSGTLTTGTTAPEWVQLGYVAGSNADVTLTDGTMANNQNFAMVYGGATGTLTMTGWSTLSAVGQIRLNAGGDNTISMSGNSAVNCNNEVFGGLWGGNSTLTMSDNASILAGSLADFGAGNLGLGWQGGKITVDMSGNSTMRSGFMGYWGRDAGSVVNLTMTGSSKVGSTWNEMRFGSNGGTATIVMDGDNPADPVTFGNWVSGADCWYINIGEDAGSTGNLTMHNSSLVTTSYDLNFASTGASSTVLMDGNAAIYVGGELKVGNGGNAVGSMTVGSTTGTAIVSVGAHMRIGYNSSTGTLNIGPGANIGVNQWLQIGNVDAGADNLALTSYVNQTGGTITKNAVGGTYVMIGRGTNAVWTISDGLADIRGLASMGNRGASGTLNLNGGVFSIGAIQAGFEADAAAIMRINFNGGTLKVNTLSDIVPSGGSWFVTKYASADALITIADAGATIDTSGVDCHIDVPIVEAVAATTGGLDKEGLGQLELTVSPTYTGDTIVNAGGLKVPSLTTSPNIYVADTATLTAGSIVSETLTIGGGPYTFAAAAASSTPIGVPEPSTIVMLVLAGLGALLAWRRK